MNKKRLIFTGIFLFLTAVGYNNCGNVDFSHKLYGTTGIGNPMTPPAFQQVQEFSVVDNSSLVSMPSFTNPVLSGDFILCAIFYNSTTQSVSSLTDTMGNGYWRLEGPTTVAAGNLVGWTLETWYPGTNITGGSNLSISANFTGVFSGEKDILCNEYSGMAPPNAVDVARSEVGVGANASAAPMVTNYPNELIFGVGVFDVAGATAGPGFTPRSSFKNIVIEDKTVNTIGNYTATFNNSSMNWNIQFAGIKGQSP